VPAAARRRRASASVSPRGAGRRPGAAGASGSATGAVMRRAGELGAPGAGHRTGWKIRPPRATAHQASPDAEPSAPGLALPW
jgi:hypothetical protein